MRNTKLHFGGMGHTRDFMAAAAAHKGFEVDGRIDDCSFYFACNSEPPSFLDVLDWHNGNRWRTMIIATPVPPGHCREIQSAARAKDLDIRIIYQPELLRASDAVHRAIHPEMIIVGTEHGAQSYETFPADYIEYLMAFDCPVHLMTWEEAELAKAAINAALISQIKYANWMASIAKTIGADWSRVAAAIKFDKRIGHHAYLQPGDWMQSEHLRRDFYTLRQTEERAKTNGTVTDE